MNITPVRFYIEQMSSILSDLIHTDPDDFSYNQIADSIKVLNSFASGWRGEDDAEIIVGLIDQALPDLFVARRLASDSNRGREYYECMLRVRRVCETITSMT